MNVEELSQLPVIELRARANAALKKITDTMSDWDRANLWAEAQFFIDEIERREQAREREEHAQIAARDYKLAARDYKLEIWVIVLIGIEILLSIAGIVIGYVEAKSQTTVLAALKASVDTLNVSTDQTAKNIGSLTKAQGEALSTQKDSLTTISAMNTAMQNQLAILREDQKQRLAEQKKKPVLELTSDGLRLNTMGRIPLIPKQMNSTSARLEFILRNTGDEAAKDFGVYVGTDKKEVTLSSENGSRVIPFIPEENIDHVILIPIDRLIAGGKTVLVLNLAYPADVKKPIILRFWANGENVPLGLNLGSLELRPPVF